MSEPSAIPSVLVPFAVDRSAAPHNRGGNEESHPPVHLSDEPDRWDGARYLRV